MKKKENEANTGENKEKNLDAWSMDQHVKLLS